MTNFTVTSAGPATSMIFLYSAPSSGRCPLGAAAGTGAKPARLPATPIRTAASAARRNWKAMENSCYLDAVWYFDAGVLFRGWLIRICHRRRRRLRRVRTRAPLGLDEPERCRHTTQDEEHDPLGLGLGDRFHRLPV